MYIDTVLTDKNGNSTELYTKKRRVYIQLLSYRLQLPAAMADDTLINVSIAYTESKVKRIWKFREFVYKKRV
jgi:hypothetical protein